MMGRLFLLLCLGRAWASRCQHREPEGLASVQKTPGDSGFSVHLSGDPRNYKPGATYTVSLSGDSTEGETKQFSRFVLVAENEDTQRLSIDSGSSGNFQLLGDVHTRFSDHCTNTVTETSNVKKEDVQVLWSAPPAGSGCVHFKATVVVDERIWSMDDSRLTLTLCEKRMEEENTNVINDPCCACEEAKYEVMFQGLWSKETHPRDFPSSEWLLHFSDVIGASHSANYRVWEKGALASKGLEQVAKWGSPRLLESELKASSKQIRTIIKARGLWHPNVQGKTFAIFRTDPENHLVSLVSMLGPSPDWIVGISALELCLANCTWMDRQEILLYPWDAGVDDGISYESPDIPASPPKAIKRITHQDPADPMSPFYSSSGGNMAPLAKLTVQKLREYKKSCSVDSPSSSLELEALQEAEASPACRTHSWGQWSGCSVTCGKGISMRNRVYRDSVEASRARCDKQLVQKEMCASDVPVCPGDSAFYSAAPSDWVPDDTCATTEWTAWSSCSVVCGQGFRARTRRFYDRTGRKKCPHVDTVAQEQCMGGRQCGPGEEEEEVRVECSVTAWSLWSPCSASCGQGLKVRTRLYRVSREEQVDGGCNVQLLQTDECSGTEDCRSSSVCSQGRETGPCRGSFRRWYYDTKTGHCQEFFFGGCRGNANNFMKAEDCEKVCVQTRTEHQDKKEDTSLFLNDGFNNALDVLARDRAEKKSDGMTEAFMEVEALRQTVRDMEDEKAKVEMGGGQYPREGELGAVMKKLMMMEKTMMMEKQMMMFKQKQMMMAKQKRMMMNMQHPMQVTTDRPGNVSLSIVGGNRDCELTSWSPWSQQCSASCGPMGVRHRFRTISVSPLGSGSPCPNRMERRKRCRLPPCPHCQPATWESWGACSQSCGTGGVQSRRRMAGDCPQERASVETRVCRLPCCPGDRDCY